MNINSPKNLEDKFDEATEMMEEHLPINKTMQEDQEGDWKVAVSHKKKTPTNNTEKQTR